jgi:hypothetical protein
MKTSTLTQNKVPEQVVALISRLVGLIPWPLRRQAMADVTLSLIKGKHRVAEDVFGWGRSVVELGKHELRTGILCLHDLSTRRKPKAEENPDCWLIFVKSWSLTVNRNRICEQRCCIQT